MNIIIQGLILGYNKIFAMLAFWQCMVLLIPKIGKKGHIPFFNIEHMQKSLTFYNTGELKALAY